MYFTIQCCENCSIMLDITGASPGNRKASKNCLKDSTNGIPCNLNVLNKKTKHIIGTQEDYCNPPPPTLGLIIIKTFIM